MSPASATTRPPVRRIDSSAAAKALNASDSSLSSSRSSARSPVGKPSGAASQPKLNSQSPARADRRSTASSGRSSNRGDQLPTTRVSATSPDKRKQSNAVAAAASLSNSVDDISKTSSSAILSSAPSTIKSTTNGEAKGKGSIRNGQQTQAGTQEDDAVSIRSSHTLHTIGHPSPNASSASLPQLADSNARKNGASPAKAGKGTAGVTALLLQPSSDDEEGENAWESARSNNGQAQGSANDSTAFEGFSSAAELSRWRRQVLLRTGVRLFILFVICTVLLVGTLWLALPKIDEKDRPFIKIPKSLEDLKALNEVLQHYRKKNNARVLLCWIVVYMFLQAFSIPGSMYMSILAGALWGVFIALPLVCVAVATGATICYLISQTMGEALVALPKWKARVDSWKERISAYNDNLFSYMVIIRMMPVPPDSVLNLLAPHLGISIPLFWTSAVGGIFAVSFVHVTIGEKLDDMASSDDFHLLSFRNVMLSIGVCVAVMIPVLIRKKAPVAPLEDEEEVDGDGRPGAVRLPDDEDIGAGSQPASVRSRVSALGQSIMSIGRRGLGRPGQNGQDSRTAFGRSALGDEDADDFGADYDEDADELPPVSDPHSLAIAAASRSSSAFSIRPKPARVLPPEGPPGPEDLVDGQDPTEAWGEQRHVGHPTGDESDDVSDDSHLSAPFSDDRREDRGPGRERGLRRRAGQNGKYGRAPGRSGGPGGNRPNTWAGAGADALGKAGEAVGQAAGKVRSLFGGGSSGNGVVLR
ncbi:hypothetical protein OC846_006042 [Tilletia horrida]|uniref:VTT domain-containing protein n=1 Tax=Tilletia horrida TaxID=155126 RepID=A0AAN6JPP3_9BASI|nr:hypothetical protein OC846_006042 [Tilletia horrida]